MNTKVTGKAFPTHAQKAILDYMNKQGSDGKKGVIWLANSGPRGQQQSFLLFENNSRNFHLRIFNNMKERGYVQPLRPDYSPDPDTPLHAAALFGITQKGIDGIEGYIAYHKEYRRQRQEAMDRLHREMKDA